MYILGKHASLICRNTIYISGVNICVYYLFLCAFIQFFPVTVSVFLVHFGIFCIFFKPDPFCFSASISPVTFSICLRRDCVFFSLLRESTACSNVVVFFLKKIILPNFQDVRILYSFFNFCSLGLGQVGFEQCPLCSSVCI